MSQSPVTSSKYRCESIKMHWGCISDPIRPHQDLVWGPMWPGPPQEGPPGHLKSSMSWTSLNESFSAFPALREIHWGNCSEWAQSWRACLRVGRLICARWQVNDYPTVSVTFRSFHFGSSYLCGRRLHTRHHKEITPPSSAPLRPQEVNLTSGAPSLFGDSSSFFVFINTALSQKTKFQSATQPREKWILNNWHR